MALTKNSHILVSDFNELRARVIKEFNKDENRRDIGDDYKPIAEEQVQQDLIEARDVDNIAKNLYYINDITFPYNGISQNTYIYAGYNSIENALITYEGKPKEGNNSGCKAGCAGLCQGCTNGCTSGCGNSCTDSCSGTSKGDSGGGSGGCSSCSGTCTGSCTNKCTMQCTLDCTGANSGGNTCGSCTGTCSKSCSGSCTNACTNYCGNTCSGTTTAGAYT